MNGNIHNRSFQLRFCRGCADFSYQMETVNEKNTTLVDEDVAAADSGSGAAFFSLQKSGKRRTPGHIGL